MSFIKKRWNDATDAIMLEMGAPKDFASNYKLELELVIQSLLLDI